MTDDERDRLIRVLAIRAEALEKRVTRLERDARPVKDTIIGYTEATGDPTE